MNTLSATYNALKRHEDALLLQQKTLQLELRSLPENHPNLGVTSLWCCLTFNQMLVVLGTTMSNLATTYSELGQHEDALEMQERELHILRNVLPENHVDTAILLSHMSVSYMKLGDVLRALDTARQALQTYQRALPPSHDYVQKAVRALQLIETFCIKHHHRLASSVGLPSP